MTLPITTPADYAAYWDRRIGLVLIFLSLWLVAGMLLVLLAGYWSTRLGTLDAMRAFQAEAQGRGQEIARESR